MKRSPIRILSLLLCVALLCGCMQTAPAAASGKTGKRLAESSVDFPVPNAGTEFNAYTETVSDTRTSFTTVKLQPGETLYYHIYGAAGKTLVVEDAAAELILDGTTYTPKDGMVTAAIAVDAASPLVLQIGNTGGEAAVFTLDFAWEPETTEPTEPPTEPTEPPTEPTEPEPQPGESADDPVLVDYLGAPLFLEKPIPAGGTLYYRISGIAGQTVKITAPEGVSAIVNGNIYLCVGGYITIEIPEGAAPTDIQFLNSGAEDAYCRLSVQGPLGSFDNPAELTLGENTATPIANSFGEYEYNYGFYTVAEAGVLTFDLTTDATDFILTVNRADATDTVTSFDSTDGKLSIDVAAGDRVEVQLALIDSKGGDFTLDVSLAIPVEIQTSFDEENDLGEAFDAGELLPGSILIYTIKGTISDQMYFYAENIEGLSITYRGEPYTPVEGAICMNISGTDDDPVVLTIVNNGDAPTYLEFAIDYLYGSADKPARLVLGANRPTQQAGQNDYHYTYTAAKAGSLNLTAAGCSLTVANLTTGEEANGADSASIQVNAGDQLKVTVIGSGFTLTAAIEEETPPITDGMDYTVTLRDSNGNAYTGAKVQLYSGETLAGEAGVNAQGAASFYLEKGEYTVKLSFTGEALSYFETTLTAENASATVTVAEAKAGDPKDEMYFTPCEVFAGETLVKTADSVSYFLFYPQETGVYHFTTNDPQAVISYWGQNVDYVFDQTDSVNLVDNGFTLELTESWVSFPVILGITGGDGCVLRITRQGDAAPEEPELVSETYQGKTPPAVDDQGEPIPYVFEAAADAVITAVDLTAKTDDYTLVYNEEDQLYHVGSPTGPVVYVNLGSKAPYVSIYDLLGIGTSMGTGLSRTFYDGEGKAIREEDYTQCMTAYAKAIDAKTGYYPLTEDLIYMLKNSGEARRWWNQDDPYEYKFADLVDEEGNSTLNVELAWMFACVTVETLETAA